MRVVLRAAVAAVARGVKRRRRHDEAVARLVALLEPYQPFRS